MPHKLFEHQKEALAKIVDQARPALFMQMRMGKTPVIIQWAKRILAHHSNLSGQYPARVLIVGPMSILDDWANELRLEGIRRADIIRLDGQSATVRRELLLGGSGWYLINYEGVRVCDDIDEDEWTVLIADESTAIRNPQAQITKKMIRAFSHVPHRAILTGDPAPESPLDYFSQFHFLHGHFMGFENYWAFRRKKFHNPKFNTWEWIPNPGTRDEIKKYVHTRAVVMTRVQWKIGGDFAPIQRRVLEMNDAQRAAMTELRKNFSYGYIQTNFATVRDVWMARVAGGFSPDRDNPRLLSNAKTQELIHLLKGELRHEPVVVWFRFNEELEHVVRQLNRAKITAVGVTGATPPEQRQQVRKQFERGKYRVLCVQVRIGRFGWNLSHASTAIRYSNAYDLESYTQSRDRIVHPAKKRPLLEIHLVTKGSLDEEVVRLLKQKHRSSRAFMRQLNDAFLQRFRKEFTGENSENTSTRKTETSHPKKKVRRVYPGQATGLD